MLSLRLNWVLTESTHKYPHPSFEYPQSFFTHNFMWCDFNSKISIEQWLWVETCLMILTDLLSYWLKMKICWNSHSSISNIRKSLDKIFEWYLAFLVTTNWMQLFRINSFICLYTAWNHWKLGKWILFFGFLWPEINV